MQTEAVHWVSGVLLSHQHGGAFVLSNRILKLGFETCVFKLCNPAPQLKGFQEFTKRAEVGKRRGAAREERGLQKGNRKKKHSSEWAVKPLDSFCFLAPKLRDHGQTPQWDIKLHFWKNKFVIWEDS